MASAFAAESFAGPLTGYLISQGVDCVSDATLEGIIVVVITILLSYVSLVFGELVPKQLGLRYAETVGAECCRSDQLSGECDGAVCLDSIHRSVSI